jgi:ubiquinone/menaquinone biosynthesis C-methylase UbiE
MITNKTVWNTKIDKYVKEHEKSHKDSSRRFIIDRLKNNPYKSILELGIGSGILLDNLQKENITINYTGIDASIEFIKHTKKKHPNAEIIQHDFDNTLPFDDKQFDIVYARHVLEHVKHYKYIVPEMARVSSKEVVIILFRPLIQEDKISLKEHKGTYYNSYGKNGFLTLCNKLFKTTEIIESSGNKIGPSCKGLNWIIHCVKD